MPPSRASANELSKLLNAAADPLYVVAANRRIVFLNDACAAWAGREGAELLGQECQYSAAAEGSAETSDGAAAAAALCPPPEAFGGLRLTAPIVPAGQPVESRRQVEFVPLGGGDESGAAVLALVQSATVEQTPSLVDETSGPQLHARLQHYRRRLAIRHHVDRLLGDSPAMRRVRSQVKLAAVGPASVLVIGPPGSRREHVGRAIHYGDGRDAGPLTPLACPVLDTELLEATLRSLARTKLAGQRPATLLLNDVDSLPEGAQAELARSLSAGGFAARVISTARSPLSQLAEGGSFRADLACALSTLTIALPPLADRMADLPLLAQWHLEQANLRSPKQIGGCSPEAIDRLADHAWANDLRELEEVMAEAHRRAAGPLIGPQDLPPRLALASQASARPDKPEEKIVLEEYLGVIERELIVRALKRAKGNKTKAAKLLGMTRPRFYRRLVQLGLEEAS